MVDKSRGKDTDPIAQRLMQRALGQDRVRITNMKAITKAQERVLELAEKIVEEEEDHVGYLEKEKRLQKEFAKELAKHLKGDKELTKEAKLRLVTQTKLRVSLREEIKDNKEKMRVQRDEFRARYTREGIQAAASRLALRAQTAITEQLSLTNVLSRVLGTIWSQFVTRGMELGVTMASQLPGSLTKALSVVEDIDIALMGVGVTAASVARRYHLDIKEVNAATNQLLSGIALLPEELDRTTEASRELLRNLNANVGSAVELSAQVQGLTRGAISMRDSMEWFREMAEEGFGYQEANRQLATIIRMPGIMARNMQRGPNAELNQFAFTLRDRVLKTAMNLVKEFKTINLNTAQFTAMMLVAGDRARKLGANIREAEEFSQTFGRAFGDVSSMPEIMKWNVGGRIMRSMGGFGRQTMRGAGGKRVRETEEAAQTRLTEATLRQQGLTRATATAEQLTQAGGTAKLLRASGGGYVGRHVATETFAGTRGGIRQHMQEARSMYGQAGGVTPALLMEQYGIKSMRQAVMMSEALKAGGQQMEDAIKAIEVSAAREAEVKDITDPVKQAEAITRTSTGIASLVGLAEASKMNLMDNIMRAIDNSILGVVSDTTFQILQFLSGPRADIITAQQRQRGSAAGQAEARRRIEADTTTTVATAAGVGNVAYRGGARSAEMTPEVQRQIILAASDARLNGVRRKYGQEVASIVSRQVAQLTAPGIPLSTAVTGIDRIFADLARGTWTPTGSGVAGSETALGMVGPGQAYSMLGQAALSAVGLGIPEGPGLGPAMFGRAPVPVGTRGGAAFGGAPTPTATPAATAAAAPSTPSSATGATSGGGGTAGTNAQGNLILPANLTTNAQGSLTLVIPNGSSAIMQAMAYGQQAGRVGAGTV